MSFRSSSCLIVALLCLALIAGASGPKVVVNETRRDFGTVKQGERLSHPFRIQNPGDAPLTIRRMDFNLPGIKARAKPMVPAGGEGQITLEWNTASLSGEMEVEMVLALDDPQQPQVSFFLRAVIQPPIDFAPSGAIYFSVFQDETAERSIRIISNEDRPLKIDRVESPSPHYAVRLKTIQPGKVYEVLVKVQPGAAPGRYAREPIYLYTDHPIRPRLQVLANLLVKADFYADPDVVNFGQVGLAQLSKQEGLAVLLTQTLLVKKRAGEFEIQSAETDLPFLQISRSPASGKSSGFRLDVRLVPEKMQKGEILGTIRIVNSDPNLPDLVVPVRGQVM